MTTYSFIMTTLAGVLETLIAFNALPYISNIQKQCIPLKWIWFDHFSQIHLPQTSRNWWLIMSKTDVKPQWGKDFHSWFPKHLCCWLHSQLSCYQWNICFSTTLCYLYITYINKWKLSVQVDLVSLGIFDFQLVFCMKVEYIMNLMACSDEVRRQFQLSKDEKKLIFETAI